MCIRDRAPPPPPLPPTHKFEQELVASLKSMARLGCKYDKHQIKRAVRGLRSSQKRHAHLLQPLPTPPEMSGGLSSSMAALSWPDLLSKAARPRAAVDVTGIRKAGLRGKSNKLREGMRS
eukprot:TRINITY_DN57017_c0_g1_i1.p1 TRINITY_DN57017_c0_g1~~TRINITY_DN57017_c0_g1_i1.p1  ORF type:complete len:120 (-),score=15.70 TRINITY_DN57017_c0_g1_i1:488-847(-)